MIFILHIFVSAMKACFNCRNDTIPLCGSKKGVFDFWSLAHASIGAVTGVTAIFWGYYAFLFALGISILWEIVENSRWGIQLCRAVCCDQDYEGDHIFNSVADVLCNMVGATIIIVILQ